MISDPFYNQQIFDNANYSCIRDHDQDEDVLKKKQEWNKRNKKNTYYELWGLINSTLSYLLFSRFNLVLVDQKDNSKQTRVIKL